MDNASNSSSNSHEIAKSVRHALATNANMSTSLRTRQQIALEQRKRSGTRVLLLDTSGSMEQHGTGRVSRIDALWQIVQQLRAERLDFLTCTFNTHPVWNDMTSQPYPSGDTRLLEALQFVSDTANLVSITLVHDGEPANMIDCLAYAKQLHIPINVVFVGNEHDSYAIAFARDLAASTGGTFACHNLNLGEHKALSASTDIRLMLTAGAELSNPENKPIAL